MAYTYTYTGVRDRIAALNVGVRFVEVRFETSGSYTVDYVANPTSYFILKEAEVGQELLVAARGSHLAWVKKVK